MEEDTKQTNQEGFQENREKAFMLVRNLWRDFGPLVVGALVLVIVLVGGWTLFKKSQPNQNPQEVTLDTQSSEVVLPESSISLSGSPSPATGSPTPTPKPTASPLAKTKGGQPQVATGSSMTKGGQLPKTGPEVLYSLASIAAISGGYLLFKKAHKLL